MSEPSGKPATDGDGDYCNPQFLRLVEEVWSKLPRGPAEECPRDDPPPAADVATTDPTPVLIGRFEIRRELGRGGGGIVLLAFDPRLRRTVAMKVPGPEALLSSRARQRFLSEAQAVAALRHPNIVTIHEAGEAGPIPYIIMDHCEGGSLADWLSRRAADCPAPPGWAARLVAQIADGVQHAHDRGILHRDLKPSNVLFHLPAADSAAEALGAGAGAGSGDRAGEPSFIPMVADFGLARFQEASDPGLEQTLEGVPLGTFPYMASEAVRGDRAAIGCATDVYGLGVILLELLTRRRPFAGSSRAELLDQILHAEPPSPRTVRPDLPIELERICLKCLRKKPSDRYQTPSEVASDLRRFLDGSEVPDPTEPAATRNPVKTSPGGRRVWAAVLGLAVVATLALAGPGLWFRSRAANQARVLDGLLRQLESAELAGLPALVPRIDPAEPAAAVRLARMFAGGPPSQKLAAALVLARDGSEASNYCYEQLLRASPGAIPPIARLLEGRTTGLPARLKREIEAPPGPGPATEAQDRRRASAACALLALGQGNEGWSLLRFAPDPQARSFLIHWLGPAGIAPERIVDRLVDEGDPSIRRALIQSLGAVPEASWPASLRQRVRSHLSDLYENDSDPGVHGSCKWLLLRWNRDEDLRKLDSRLARSPQPSDRRWRISPLGLTLVTVRDLKTKRVIEVADTEVTVELFLKFRSDHNYQVRSSPGSTYPVNNLNYILAARFCNWLSEQEGISMDQLVYHPGDDLPIEPVRDQSARAGYRLLTTQEYERACRAGTTTARYHGDCASLLHEYAWCGQTHDPQMHPVARLKPNEYGLFDMLGSADEICQGPVTTAGPRKQAWLCGGSVAYQESSIRCDLKRGPVSVTQGEPLALAFGFRVARTIAASK